MKKGEARNHIRERLANMSKNKKIAESEVIFNKLIADEDFSRGETVFIYLSTEDEVDTYTVLDYLFCRKRRVVVPLCLDDRRMVAVEIKSLKDVKSGMYGIMEPKEYCKEISKDKIDLAIIPCLAFDSRGYRLGKGKGYYDRFLSDFKGVSILVGFSSQKVEDLELDPWDQICNKVITY